ncbi:hypothetical protein GZH49_34675 [Nocardia terpenica]|uniref:hypothetical protein n=1 Tax=Nocardia terpenica TaxID=455432 RepID=UPI002FE3937C
MALAEQFDHQLTPPARGRVGGAVALFAFIQLDEGQMCFRERYENRAGTAFELLPNYGRDIDIERTIFGEDLISHAPTVEPAHPSGQWYPRPRFMNLRQKRNGMHERVRPILTPCVNRADTAAMTTSDRRADARAADSRTGSLRYGGPVLVMEPHGNIAAAACAAARRQCQARGVDVVVKLIDELPHRRRLFIYPGLIAVLPSHLPLPPAAVGTLERIGEIVTQYRTFRPDGITALATGQAQWFETGIVQIAGLATVLDHPKMKPIIPLACAAHTLSEQSTSPEVDFFSIYGLSDAGATLLPRSISDQSLDSAWLYLNGWGITTPEQALLVRQVIESCQEDFRTGDRYRQPMQRPIEGSDLTRLDYILGDPNHRGPKKQRKTWMENGARAVRITVEKIQQAVPGVARPADRDGTKGAQVDLHQLYANLLVLTNSPEFGASIDGVTVAPAEMHEQSR